MTFESFEHHLELEGFLPEPTTELPVDELIDHIDLTSKVYSFANEILTELGFEETIQDELESDRLINEHNHTVVEAVVGDDEAGLCTAKSYGPIKVSVSHVLSGMRVSVKDTAFSRSLINYAEGYIIITPTSKSGFHHVNSRAKLSGVPLVFDPIKVKLVSPVRKQSTVDEMDIESKFKHLSVIAAYADKDWLTYHAHQAMLILACTIFDFRDGRSFPFLYPTEGGCGGLPPYGSVDTAKVALFHFNRGRSQKGVLGAMRESNLIKKGDVSPEKSFFLRNIRMSTADTERWRKIRARFLKLQELEGTSEAETSALIDSMMNIELPEEIASLGHEVNPNHWLMGYALSRLRRYGFIMTDLDVKIALLAKERYYAIGGSKPLSFVLAEQEQELRSFKSKAFETLSTLVTDYKDQMHQIDQSILQVPELFGDESSHLMRDYYQQRLDSSEDMTSFIYTTSIRVYDQALIKRRLEMPSISLYANLGEYPSRSQNVLSCPETIYDEAIFEEIKEWYENTPLNELLSGRIPSGLFVDDPRIIESVNNTLRICNDQKANLVIFLVSNDRVLHDKTRSMIHMNQGHAHVIYVAMNLRLYMDLCIMTQKYQTKSGIKFYSIISKGDKFLPRDLYRQIKSGFPNAMAKTIWSFEYDFPNIEKSLGYLNFQPGSSISKPFSVTSEGGFLQRRSLSRFTQKNVWCALDTDTLYKWPDFQVTERTHPYQEVSRERVLRASSTILSVVSYSESSWKSVG